MSQNADTTNLETLIRDLKGWVEALARRVEDLEATAFQLVENEEVILVTVPRHKSGQKGTAQTEPNGFT